MAITTIQILKKKKKIIVVNKFTNFNKKYYNLSKFKSINNIK